MIYDKDKGAYVLKSGRGIYGPEEMFGLGPGAKIPYDGDGDLADDSADTRRKLTADERYEIAAEMIHRWLRWAEGKRGRTDAPARRNDLPAGSGLLER